MGDWAISKTVGDPIRRCLLALNDPRAERGNLRHLLAECSDYLTELAAERRTLRRALRTEIEEIATLVASQEAVWPEEVVRLQALSQEIRSRAARLADD